MADTLIASPVDGRVAPGFEKAREAFEANFAIDGAYRECGAAFAVFHSGRQVVDLWGGFADAARTRPFQRDSLVNVWSSTKGLTAVAVARLVDQGKLAYEQRVAEVWPEFAAAGKEEITVGQVMSHQAGLTGFAEPTTIEDEYDWAGCTAKLARQAPAFPPGSATSYHAMTYGWLAGEIVRRVSGKSPGAYAREEICAPLAADFFIGLPLAEEGRVAELIGPVAQFAIPDLPPHALMAVTNPQQDPAACNTRAWRAAEIPAANGQASALGLARLYAALAGGGALEGTRILSLEGVARLTTRAAPDGREDDFLGFVDSWAYGVALNTMGIYGRNPRAFGHSGWGGSFGFADPDADLAVGYVCNQMGPELVGDPRTEGLCRAVYATI